MRELPADGGEWRREEVFHDADSFFRRLLEEIASAKKSIELETYIFDRDRLGLSVLSALVAAASRGVRVRLLIDGFGCWQWTLGQLEELRRDGVSVRAYHPLPWQNRQAFAWLGALSLRRLLLGFFKLNRRNHRKVCLIDRRRAFVGSMNVTLSPVRDTSVLVEGKGIASLAMAFERAWRHHRSLRQRVLALLPARARPGRVRLNQTGEERKRAYAELLQRILGAQRRVWIANPYFVPDISLVRALRFAAWNGVQIRLLFPRKNNIWGFQWAAKAYYLVLLAAGARIFEYRPKLLHAKVVLIDDWAKVGSSNLNHRSLLHDLEVDLVLGQHATIASLEAQYLLDLSEAEEIKFGSWKGRDLPHRLLQRLALLFRRWI